MSSTTFPTCFYVHYRETLSLDWQTVWTPWPNDLIQILFLPLESCVMSGNWLKVNIRKVLGVTLIPSKWPSALLGKTPICPLMEVDWGQFPQLQIQLTGGYLEVISEAFLGAWGSEAGKGGTNTDELISCYNGQKAHSCWAPLSMVQNRPQIIPVSQTTPS